jgi:hypothetical protein
MSKVYPIRAGEDDRAKWQECADRAGLSFNAWAVKALNSETDLEQALERLEEPKALDVQKVFHDFAFKPHPKPERTKKGRR